jgi:hypothetical protein
MRVVRDYAIERQQASIQRDTVGSSVARLETPLARSAGTGEGDMRYLLPTSVAVRQPESLRRLLAPRARHHRAGTTDR